MESVIEVTPTVVPEEMPEADIEEKTEEKTTEEKTTEDTVVQEDNTQEAVVTKPIATKTPVSEEKVEPTGKEEKSGSPVKVVAVIVLVLTLVALAVYYVLKKSKEKKMVTEPVEVPIMQRPLENPASNPYAVRNEVVADEVYHGLTVILEDVVRKHKVPVRLYEYAAGRFVSIGRNREKCDVAIDYDNGISQVHCVLYSTDDGIYVEDCQSTNHTYLNGNPVVEPERISEGDILTLGKVKFSVHIVQR